MSCASCVTGVDEVSVVSFVTVSATRAAAAIAAIAAMTKAAKYPALRAVPYPAACRPQAWSAAASVAVLAVAADLTPAGLPARADPGLLRVWLTRSLCRECGGFRCLKLDRGEASQALLAASSVVDALDPGDDREA